MTKIDEIALRVAELSKDAEPIYQLQCLDGMWIDQSKESYEYNLANGYADSLRIVFTSPANTAEIEQRTAEACARAAITAWHKDTCYIFDIVEAIKHKWREYK